MEIITVPKTAAVTKYFFQDDAMKILSGLEFPIFVPKRMTLLTVTHPGGQHLCSHSK